MSTQPTRRRRIATTPDAAPAVHPDPDHPRTRGSRTTTVVQSRTIAKGQKVERTLSAGEEELRTPADQRVTTIAHPALVRVGIGTTVNMENYEFLRIDVSVTLPCHPEDIEDTYIRASEFVGEKLTEEENLWTRG